jgi:hypothetical protein
MLQRLLKMLEGLNFNEFIALLSAFSSLPEIEDKLNCDCTLCNVYRPCGMRELSSASVEQLFQEAL